MSLIHRALERFQIVAPNAHSRELRREELRLRFPQKRNQGFDRKGIEYFRRWVRAHDVNQGLSVDVAVPALVKVE
jgi:hypothetical protein